jgi:hypothetical protein
MLQLPKLATPVRLRSPAPFFSFPVIRFRNAADAGSFFACAPARSQLKRELRMVGNSLPAAAPSRGNMGTFRYFIAVLVFVIH